MFFLIKVLFIFQILFNVLGALSHVNLHCTFESFIINTGRQYADVNPHKLFMNGLGNPDVAHSVPSLILLCSVSASVVYHKQFTLFTKSS
jgi:hypothetical protein